MRLDGVAATSHDCLRQGAGGPPACRKRGSGALRMKRFDAAAALLLAVTLAGCDFGAVRLDPLDVNGRDGAERPLTTRP